MMVKIRNDRERERTEDTVQKNKKQMEKHGQEERKRGEKRERNWDRNNGEK